MSENKMTPIDLAWFQQAKERGERIPCLTAYDYSTARLLDQAGIPLLLVGDSLGMVVLGFPDTTQVTIDHIAHHTAAVARAQTRSFIVADLPYQSYQTPEEACLHAEKLITAGAQAVKLEGGLSFLPQITALRQKNIPVVGHLGMLPQSVREEGGYHVKGKNQEESDRLLQEALALTQAGIFALVLELVVPSVALHITQKLPIPTIGIGSGNHTCDGDILVTHDLAGLFPWYRPRFLKEQKTAQLGLLLQQQAELFAQEVKKK